MNADAGDAPPSHGHASGGESSLSVCELRGAPAAYVHKCLVRASSSAIEIETPSTYVSSSDGGLHDSACASFDSSLPPPPPPKRLTSTLMRPPPSPPPPPLESVDGACSCANAVVGPKAR